MPTTFAKAPLVEIIVDVQWSPVPTIGAPRPPAFMLLDGDVEGFMSRFAEAASKIGFQRSERLVPQGFPVPPGQPVYRFRPSNGEQKGLMKSALLQVGACLFSANAVPPYSSWEEFRPTVRSGLEALLVSRSETDRLQPFSLVSLRYIDVFTKDFSPGDGAAKFISDVLGLKVILPAPITKHQAPGGIPKLHMVVDVPLVDGLSMGLSVGEAYSPSAELVTRMEWVVRSIAPVVPEVDQMMSVLERARTVIHDAFFGITEPIHALMQPK